MKNLFYVLFFTVIALLFSDSIRNKPESNSVVIKFKGVKESVLFEFLVQYEKYKGLHFKKPQDLKRLRIDPHLVNDSYSCCKHIPDFVQKKDFATLSHRLVNENRKILKRHKIPSTDALRDQECIFSEGLPEPPPHDHPQKKHSSPYPKRCEKQGFFLTVFFSQPKVIKENDCANSKNKNQLHNKNSKCWRVLAFEYTSYSRFIYALYLVKNSKMVWKIVLKKRLYGVYS